jgi:GNAT superfamily N-acetyltransferase
VNPVLDRNGYHDLPPGKIAAVTTYLEMREPPPARPVPPRPDLALSRLERAEPARYRDLFRRVGADWLWFSRLLMPDERLAEILHDPRVEVWTLVRGGEGVGLLELDRRQADEVELAFFGLVADAVGGGAGRVMMDHAIRRAFAEPIRRLWVHTCTLDHPAALAFYVRSGFTAYARSVEVADDPRVTGDLPRTAAPWLPIIG